MVLALAVIGAALGAEGWLDGDPDAIWQRPPGFYQEGGRWYAIVHTKQTVTRVRLAGEFTEWADSAVELTKTPDGKFWWFKGEAAEFARPPKSGDKYKFILNECSPPDQWRQDPAARRVENSSLGANSIVTKRRV